jgi:phage shock protein PspC (stress-responsive transcriptional regulator)
MGSKTLLRTAGVMMFINAAIHIYTHFKWQTATEEASTAIIKQLPSAKLSILGISHSLADYFDGYAWIVAIFLVLIGMLLWALGDISEEFAAPSLKILIPIVVFLMVLFFYTILFFIPGEAGFSGLAILCCTRAIVLIHKGHLDWHEEKANA